jgi:spore germination cell wall hydrolase CwlJ-like protein
MKNFLLSLLLVTSSTVVVAEVTFKDQMINQANTFVTNTAKTLMSPFLSDKDVECLARNIFYEAGSEPVEGKVAVAMVTLNRTQDERYPQSVCGVVKQRTVVTVPQKTTEIKTVKQDWLTPPKQIVETRTIMITKAICQFSWTCQRVNTNIREDDPRWIESKQIAEEVARGGYENWQEKYANAMNFHAIYVNPGWKLKRITRIGNHIFYEGTKPIQQGG